MTNYMLDIFWSPKFWLPQGYNWSTFSNNNDLGYTYPQFHDMYVPLYLSLVFLLIRTIFEWFLARPFGCWLGIKDDARCEMPTILRHIHENFFGDDEKINSRQRKIIERSLQNTRSTKSTLAKFAECSWRFSFYFLIFVYGLCVMWNKPWLWNSVECWTNYPHHNLTSDIWWYYVLECSFYWSLMWSQFFDTHRKVQHTHTHTKYERF